MRTIRLLVFSLLMILAPSVTLAATAQQPTALGVLRALPLDTLPGDVIVYYSPGYRERAATLQRTLGAAVGFYENKLSYHFDVRVAVLTKEHWAALDWGTPYGMPWYTYRDAVPVVLIPATTDHGVVVDLLRSRLGDEGARRAVDNIGLHELGHVIVQEYLYPGNKERTPSVRWFDEMMADYVELGYRLAKSPAALKHALGRRATKNIHPAMTSLDDFETHYWALAKNPNAANYGWYQGHLVQRAAQVFQVQGFDFLRKLKEKLPWKQFDQWKSDDLLEWLEHIQPGFKAWAASLEK